MKVLTEDVELQVKIEKEIGEPIVTDTGVPQGDCLSAILFITYLAAAMKPVRPTIDEEHNYALPRINFKDKPCNGLTWHLRRRT